MRPLSPNNEKICFFKTKKWEFKITQKKILDQDFNNFFFGKNLF